MLSVVVLSVECCCLVAVVLSVQCSVFGSVFGVR